MIMARLDTIEDDLDDEMLPRIISTVIFFGFVPGLTCVVRGLTALDARESAEIAFPYKNISVQVDHDNGKLTLGQYNVDLCTFLHTNKGWHVSTSLNDNLCLTIENRPRNEYWNEPFSFNRY